MRYYCGIDLRGNNSFVATIDETDRVMVDKKSDNNLETIHRLIEPYREDLVGIAVESTSTGIGSSTG